ncbi:hypothetical protein ACIGZJ_36860 [Kitasatospora sp. NPDC052868]|uniref:hypothetical protein n=1 Tax=Kitasatospora sp. NPDC052868 TaxID=3364060 RepID=UPI0037C6AC62
MVKVDNIRDWGDDSDDKNLELYGEAGVEHANGQKKEWKRTDSNPQKSRPEYCPGGGICRGTGSERDSGVHIGYGQRINAEFTGSAASDSPFVFYTNLWDWDYSYADIDEHVAWGSYKVWPDAAAAKWTSNGCMAGRLCQVKSFTINGPGGPVMHIQFEKPAN